VTVVTEVHASVDGADFHASRGDMTGTDRTALRQLVEEGNEEAADRLANLATWDYLIDNGVASAADRRAGFASERGETGTLQRLADEGSRVAKESLNRLISDAE